jgi:WD40 repeat protein
MHRAKVLLILILGLLWLPVKAQPTISTERMPITSQNVDKLQMIGRFGRGSINDMALSPDGKTLAVGTSIGIWLYDPDNLQREPEMLVDADNYVTMLDFSPDGRFFAFLLKNTLHLWAWNIRTPIMALPDADSTFAFSPDNRLLAYSRSDHTVYIWDLQTRTYGKQFGGAEYVNGLAFSPDSQKLAMQVDAAGEQIQIWDVEQAVKLATTVSVPLWTGGVIAFSPDGSLLAFANGDETKLWDWQANTFRSLDTGEIVSSVTFNSDGKRLLVGRGYALGSGADDFVQLWDVETGKQLSTFGLQTKGLTQAAFHPDGARLFIAGTTGVQSWDIARHVLLQSTPDHFDAIYSLALSSDETQLVVGMSDGTVSLLDMRTGKETVFPPLPKPDLMSVSKLQFTPDNRYLIGASNRFSYPSDGQIVVWEVETHRQVLTVREGLEWGVQDMAVSPDGRWLAFSHCFVENQRCTRGRVEVWDIEKGVFQAPLDAVGDQAELLAFTPDSRYIAVSGWHAVRIWDVQTGQMVNELPLPSAWQYSIISLIPASDKQVFGLAYESNASCPFSVYSFSAQTRSADWASHLSGHALISHSQNIVFNAGGDVAAAPSGENILLYHSNPCGRHELNSAGRAGSAVFNRKSDLLISGGLDGVVRLWAVQPN